MPIHGLKSKKGRPAPPEMVASTQETPQEAATKMGPSGLTSDEKEKLSGPAVMFGGPAAAKPKVAAAAVPAQAKPKAAAPAVPAPSKAPAAAVPAQAKAAPVVLAEPPKKMSEKLKILDTIQAPTLKKLGQGFLKEELEVPYEEAPRAYIPETHRGFSKFIKTTYDDFILPPPGEGPAMEPGEKYPYQRFIREYMRQASPYRGILVYHGLGSGKTCSAIAASEALFSTSGKKIIVMTPFSLRKNFLKEVSFCGFRHFRLLNYWVALPKDGPMGATHRMFALEILGLSESYLRTATSIWVPDFDQANSNYDSLAAEQQTEIRKQILSQLVWDAEKNPKGRIRFINYNGISAKRLKKLACETPDFFDDAVIVVDEVHNLVRLMQGEIDPYLKDLPGKKRKVAREVVGVDKWAPSLCGKDTNYRRGYLFYRLMLSARRSKLIGLSGTPLINFPEELGILANVLHGYIQMIKVTINQTDDKSKALILNIAKKNRNVDYVSVDKSTAQLAGTELVVTLLPEGVQKVVAGEGVERIAGGVVPSPTEIQTALVEALKASGLTVRGEPSMVATPLLNPFGEEFRDDFLTADGLELKNKFVLGKRLTGLISYYKGSRQDLMPSVAVDEVVRVPFSTYSQGAYSKIRLEEIEIEKKKKDKGVGGLGAVWAEVYEIGQMKQSSNYRMGSRQMCNFAFPSSVTRPRARNTEEEEMENTEDKDITDAVPDDEPVDESRTFDIPELEQIATDETDAAEEEVSEVDEKKKIYYVLTKLVEALYEKGMTVTDIEDKVEGGRQYFKLAIPLSAEKLSLLDDDFKTLKFTPDGFSGVDGDDLNDDLGLLVSRFVVEAPEADAAAADEDEEAPKEGGGKDDKKPEGTLSYKEMMAKKRADKAAAKPAAELDDLVAMFENPGAAPSAAVGAELKKLDKLVKQEAKGEKKAETSVKKMLAKMRAEGQLQPYTVAGYDASEIASAAGATETEQTTASITAQDAYRAAIRRGETPEEAMKTALAAGAATYVARPAAAKPAAVAAKPAAVAAKPPANPLATASAAAKPSSENSKRAMAKMRAEGTMPPRIAVSYDAGQIARAAHATDHEQGLASVMANDAYAAAIKRSVAPGEAVTIALGAAAAAYVAAPGYEDAAAQATAAFAEARALLASPGRGDAAETARAKAQEIVTRALATIEAAAAPPEQAPAKVSKSKIKLVDALKLERRAPLEPLSEEAAAELESLAVKPKRVVAQPVVVPVEKGALRCKGGIQQGETYKQALARSKECLRKPTVAPSLLLGEQEDSLKKYSPKYAAILQRIIDAPGSSLVYSQFLDMEGIGIFRLVMDINNFAPIEIVSTPNGPEFTPLTKASLLKGPYTADGKGQMRYMTFSGEEKEDVRRMALDVFNARFDELHGNLKKVLLEGGFTNNHTGQLCRVFCITSAGAEGLSLKSVRAVHIMEPYWNDVRLKQVKGRAIRIGSHLELPEDQRNVSIYTYIGVFSKDAQTAKDKDGRIDETIRNRDSIPREIALKVGLIKEGAEDANILSYVLTSDERLYVISERKKKVIEDLENVMKGAAVDCQLNMAEHMDEKFQCLSLESMVGDFVYMPELKKDIAAAESSFKEEVRFAKGIEWNKKQYWAVAEVDAKGTRTGFSLYDIADTKYTTALGTTAVNKAGLPVEPVVIF